MGKYDIFISYSREDVKCVSRILSFIEKDGYSVWIDKTGIETGEQFKNVIVDAISRCKVFIFVSSKASNCSEWTEKEIGVAVTFHKKIIPIKIDSSPYNSSVLLDLVNLNYIDYGDIKHRKEQLKKLKQDIALAIPKNAHDTENKRELSKRKKFGSNICYIWAINLKNFINKNRTICIGCILLLIILSTRAIALYTHYIRSHTYTREYILPQHYGEVRDIKQRPIATVDSLYDLCIDPMLAYGDDWQTDRERIEQLVQELNNAFPGLPYKVQSSKIIERRHEHYCTLLRNLTIEELNIACELPAWELTNRKSQIIFKNPSFYYPYGVLANRTIGYGTHGIVGRFKNDIVGKSGMKEVEIRDMRGKKRTKIKEIIPPTDGYVVTSTLDMDLQTIADNVLRSHIATEHDIIGASLVIMSVRSGAILSMVNLSRTDDNLEAREIYNHAIGHSFEPGTLGAGVTLAACCSDDMFRINGLEIGKHEDNLNIQEFLGDSSTGAQLYKPTLLRINSTQKNMSIREGCIKANAYSLSSLVMHKYRGKLIEYLDILNEYHVCDSIPLEILGSPKGYVGVPRDSDNYNRFLTTLGSGYGIMITPIQLHTFYNGILNGRYTYPYIIESISTRSGETIYNHELKYNAFPSAFRLSNGDVQDTLKSIMCSIAQQANLNNSQYHIGAIIGESLSTFPYSEKDLNDAYLNKNGMKSQQAGCFAYFPNHNPEYSVMCIIFTRATNKNFFGKDIPTSVVRNLSNMIYDYKYKKTKFRRGLSVEM